MRHARRERGASLVEMTLSLIVLLTLVFGIIEVSEALYTYEIISDAAREGTRYAMVRGSACSAPITPCPATSANVQTYLRGIALPGINPTLLTATATWPTTGSSCTPSVSPCNNPGNVVQVTVNYSFRMALPFVRTSTITLTSTSQMVIST